jgi:hypothetical protein
MHPRGSIPDNSQTSSHQVCICHHKKRENVKTDFQIEVILMKTNMWKDEKDRSW